MSARAESNAGLSHGPWGVGPVVVKLGGAAMDVECGPGGVWRFLGELHRRVARGVVVVHGGGSAVDRQLRRMGHESVKHDGIRATPLEQIEDVVGVLAGVVNKKLVGRLASLGLPAVGLSLGDGGMVVAELETLPGIDLGCVGRPSPGDPRLLSTLLGAEFLPVVSSIGLDEGGKLLNVNADQAAAALAQTVGASAVVLLTDTPGILDEHGVCLSRVSAAEAEALIERGVIARGMVAKTRAALSVAEGVSVPVFIAPWNDDTALESLAAGAPFGTMIVRSDCRMDGTTVSG